jgi:hypothetical protein
MLFFTLANKNSFKITFKILKKQYKKKEKLSQVHDIVNSKTSLLLKKKEIKESVINSSKMITKTDKRKLTVLSNFFLNSK